MAGAYGEINSNVDFQRVLAESLAIARRILAGAPDNSVMQRINKQLDAMRRWSANGRTPTDGERRSIDVGLVAARELSEATGETTVLAHKLFVLNNYFEDWPTDDQAASDSDEDFDDGDGDE